MGGELRGSCQGLLARIQEGMLELKCRRCKRVVVIFCRAIEKIEGLYRSGTVRPEDPRSMERRVLTDHEAWKTAMHAGISEA